MTPVLPLLCPVCTNELPSYTCPVMCCAECCEVCCQDGLGKLHA
jgi:hypothetical protein